ncbi:MAG: response regulator transcription factor [Bacteroidales bacterium]|nr:response regulator transcription factor [Bacteroidales bacterium]
MIKVTIADDHQLVVDGISTLLENSKLVKVIDKVYNGVELIRSLSVLLPDIVLMDIDMPVMNGIEAMQEIRKRFPELKVIILTMHEERQLIKKFDDLGVKGFILKNTDHHELILAITRVAEGKNYYSAALTLNLLSSSRTNTMHTGSLDSKKALLTDREIEILKLIAEGLSNKEIGEKLFISHRTVDTHRTNLMNKLEVTNIAGLIRYAIKHGFVH